MVKAEKCCFRIGEGLPLVVGFFLYQNHKKIPQTSEEELYGGPVYELRHRYMGIYLRWDSNPHILEDTRF